MPERRQQRSGRRCASAPPAAGNCGADELRRDLRLIADMIEPGARVLDIGCGDGALLAYLARHKGVDGRGMTPIAIWRPIRAAPSTSSC
jgi:2-polyprenyl-3-methyl-5-hydroxy-6-metoxy-1,4-benzoquinol methylase